MTRAYRAAQQLLLGGDNRQIPEKDLEMFRFVRRYTQAVESRPQWERLRKIWNQEYPKWSYNGRSGFSKAHERAQREFGRLMHPGYNRPKWKRRPAADKE